GQAFPHLTAILAGTPIFQNPPDHTHTRAWLKESISQLAERWPARAIEGQAAEFLDHVDAGRSQDVIDLLADALPNALIAAHFEADIAAIRQLRRQGTEIAEAWRPVPLRNYPRIEDSAE